MIKKKERLNIREALVPDLKWSKNRSWTGVSFTIYKGLTYNLVTKVDTKKHMGEEKYLDRYYGLTYQKKSRKYRFSAIY